MQNMDANPLPHPDHDWTVVNFPGTLPLEGLVEDDEPDPAATAAESGPDLLRPFWSDEPPPVAPPAPPNPDQHSASRLGSGSVARSRPVDVAQLVAAAEALQRENVQLRQQVDRLEAAVSECRAALELQQMRTQTQQSLYDARSRDLEIACQEAQRLATELTAARDALAQQAAERADWAAQHQQAEGQIANLERSCALLQERCLRQSDQLNQSHNTVQDLRDRLDRQQRQTLQLRAALEQCLEQDYRRGEPAAGMPAVLDEPGDPAEFEPITPSGAIAPTHPSSVESTEPTVTALEPVEPTESAASTVPGTEAIRTEDILALLNWDLSPQSDPSYRIASARSSSLPLADQPPADHHRAIDAPPELDDVEALDALAEALWLSDWPRPLAPTEWSGLHDEAHDSLADHLDDPKAGMTAGRNPELDGPELAPPLAELLSIEAELLDWPTRSPEASASADRWPAPTLSVPRKRRSSMAAVELPKW
jgi:hypothetical protein